MAKCTNVTFLMRKAAGEASFSKLIDVTNYPDMGGDPEKIDVTTLSHTRRHNIDGIEDVGDGLDFDAFYEIISSGEPSGRKLDFLMQELNRETNTIGSKANNARIARIVVNMKGELEKIREQIQNIE